jgi:hypothetical protein
MFGAWFIVITWGVIHRHCRVGGNHNRVAGCFCIGKKKPPINGGTANSRNQQISCFSSLRVQDSILIFLYNTKSRSAFKK